MAKRTGRGASDQVKQQLSDWMDNELPEEERALLWARILHDEELAARWERYHLIGDVVRNRVPSTPATDVASRVGHRIRSEKASPPRRRFTAGLAGGTVAASLIALVSLAAVELPGVPGADLLSGSSQAAIDPTEPSHGATTVVERNAPEAPPATRNLDPRTRERIRDYLTDHNAELAESGRAGSLPYLRMTDSEAAAEQ